MSAVLGISAHYHDAAAALVVDGRVVAAMQEERFSRIKNDPSVPRRAALACLAEAGLAPGDLDGIVFYENPYAKLERVLVSLLRAFPRSFRQFPRALGAQLGDKLWILDSIAEALACPAPASPSPTTTRATRPAPSSRAPTRRPPCSPSTGQGRRPWPPSTAGRAASSP